ncbi:MAG: peptide-methionine (R)-S-oxide reductase [Deltaproteobacteria bacterium]|nr:MAG: peptide-methionine (R)-S-oxide reductase [Deltaproteobacteria bacterium]
MTKLTLAALTAGSLLLAGLGASFASQGGQAAEPSRNDRVVKTDEEWRAVLTEEEFRILRKAGTERAFTGDFWDDKKPGVYTCAGCDLELFSSETKFDSGTGWPSYWAPIAEDRVDLHDDFAYGMKRTEVACARCGGHLGHVFSDGPAPTGLRYCINGNALDKIEPSAKGKGKKQAK